MATEIIVAIIAACGGIIGSFIGVVSTARLTNYRLSQLEEKVKVHNNLVDRMYKVEKEIGILEHQNHLDD